MKPAWPVFLGLIFNLYWASSVLAAIEFKIDGIENNPSEINYDQSIEVLYSFSGVSFPKTYYLAGAFQKEAGSNYFGYTWNNNWYKYGDEFTNFYKIEIKESSISGKLKIKPDVDSSGFKGRGDYQLKLFRYCNSQNSCGDTNFIGIKIVAPPSPSPEASPSTSLGVMDPSPSPSPSVSPSTPLGTASPSPQPSKIARVKDIVLLRLETPEPVLGTASGQPFDSARGKPDWQLIIMLLLTGTGLLLSTAFIMIRLWRKN
ncbi:hypothetical protein A3I57_00440 [Candidatus Beckwithbacteria bacterium RIFCSPLOWO2_02_FULL_47_23]|uniref:Uncharacterized protein n=1 Tax=Candidatus Beckwithbacteria bacterium RIFCSPLOWO2_02_FULL_47_23 TaxID=1797463 RepID=A0A1F5E397_9BACT|nr:MAG: hypothetical protein A3I57_00440 [Candidatus Beckwithbacteria bacterium RIFCSPLOWO2_02_FULL_47_23]